MTAARQGYFGWVFKIKKFVREPFVHGASGCAGPGPPLGPGGLPAGGTRHAARGTRAPARGTSSSSSSSSSARAGGILALSYRQRALGQAGRRAGGQAGRRAGGQAGRRAIVSNCGRLCLSSNTIGWRIAAVPMKSITISTLYPLYPECNHPGIWVKPLIMQGNRDLYPLYPSFREVSETYAHKFGRVGRLTVLYIHFFLLENNKQGVT